MPIATLNLVDDTVGANPIEGVLVEVYEALTANFVTSGSTAAVTGSVAFTLPNGTYNVYFYKQGVSILPKQPQQIVILTPGVGITNDFTVTAHIRVRPESTHPRRCRVTGSVWGPDGRPTTDCQILFEPQDEVILLDKNIVAPQCFVHTKPDDNGYFDFELIRGLAYFVHYRGIEKLLGITPAKFSANVPDAASVDLDTLLFPLQVSVAFSAGAIALASGNPVWDSTITATIGWSDGSANRIYPTPWSALKVENTDTEVVEAHVRDGKLLLLPLRPGVATITVSRLVTPRVIWSPLPAFTSGSVVVTVS